VVDPGYRILKDRADKRLWDGAPRRCMALRIS